MMLCRDKDTKTAFISNLKVSIKRVQSPQSLVLKIITLSKRLLRQGLSIFSKIYLVFWKIHLCASTYSNAQVAFLEQVQLV